MKRNTLIVLVLVGAFVCCLACGKRVQGPPEPVKALSVQVKLEGKAAEALELVTYTTAAIDGVMLELTLKAKKAIESDEIQLSYKTASGKTGSVKIQGPLEVGAQCKVTVQLESAEESLTITDIAE